MTTRGRLSGLLPFAALLAALASAPQAALLPVEDFEGLVPGPIDGQNGWTAPSDSALVAADPSDSENQVLSVITESTYLYRECSILNGTTRMLFLRFRVGDQLSCSFGLSDIAHPSRFDHFESEMSLTNAPLDLRVNDGGTYRVLCPVEPNTWYNLWLAIDNVTDDTRLWMHARDGQPATPEDQLAWEGQTIFDFRNGSAGDLLNFYIKTGGGSGVGGPLLIDDIHREDTDALNLDNPLAAPSASPGAPPVAELAPAYPNPFNPRVNLRFSLAEAVAVRLVVHDAAGRRLAVLAEGVYAAGSHALSWGGRDGAGQSLPSGLYFATLEAGDLRATRRLALLR